MSRHKIISLTITSLLLLQLTASGGGGSDEVSVTPPVIPPVTPPPPVNTVVSGKFIDSAVSGLTYATASKSGVTDEEGNFEYIAGENITFSIGEVALGSAAAAPLITPLSLFDTKDHTDVRVINMARLLQTLDQDSQPDNGITISNDVVSVINAAVREGFDFSDVSFEQNNIVTSVLATLGIENLVSTENALQHLINSLAENYQQFDKALPIKAFNAHTPDKQVTTNVFTPESETATELFIDVLDDGFGGPRHSRPVGDTPFYDFTAKHSAAGANLGKVYIWVDDALTSEAVIKMRLYDLDFSRLAAAGLGIGCKISAKNQQDENFTYDYTLVMDPTTWFGTIFDGATLLWDEVKALGTYDNGAGKVNLWLPLAALGRQYADFSTLS
ncbi:hypothetical protein [Rheinheimera maricola]|uniref:Carboxypeptidase regulatory-like domain-containing protein n=1 Tax=Rheinheimera maricola TaxID=2793282 RepID=A0ABS7XF71_9GAMM|nr:hypothetical protein [Rheinheimera maricola]MBZ9613377.1 hypothetical protein [Rheinheimera maricola]